MYTIYFHSLVAAKDLKKIPRVTAEKILKTLTHKLSYNPFAFGKPLLKELKGYYRLRISEYRVVYRIEKDRILIFVLHIGLRKNENVYYEAARRLGLIS